MNNGEKRYIPHTNPKWDMQLPEGMDNSDELEADIERTGWDDIAENS